MRNTTTLRDALFGWVYPKNIPKISMDILVRGVGSLKTKENPDRNNRKSVTKPAGQSNYPLQFKDDATADELRGNHTAADIFDRSGDSWLSALPAPKPQMPN
jgi:hypothetical protein